MLDLDSVVELYPAEGRDVSAEDHSLPLKLQLQLPDSAATRKHQLEYLLAKHVRKVKEWQKKFHRCHDGESSIYQPQQSNTLKRPRSSVPAFVEELQDESQNPNVKALRNSLWQFQRRAGTESNPSKKADPEQNDISTQELDAQYEREYAVLRVSQDTELEAVLSRQLKQGQQLLSVGETAFQTWKSPIWTGTLVELKGNTTDVILHSFGSVELIGRTQDRLEVPGNCISVRRVVHFDVSTTKDLDRNLDFMRKMCMDPVPKYILRATANNQKEDFAGYVNQSCHHRRVQIADLDMVPGKGQRQLILMPLFFVQRPLHSHPNLAKLIPRGTPAFLAILRNSTILGDKDADCWNFTPYATPPTSGPTHSTPSLQSSSNPASPFPIAMNGRPPIAATFVSPTLTTWPPESVPTSFAPSGPASAMNCIPPNTHIPTSLAPQENGPGFFHTHIPHLSPSASSATSFSSGLLNALRAPTNPTQSQHSGTAMMQHHITQQPLGFQPAPTSPISPEQNLGHLTSSRALEISTLIDKVSPSTAMGVSAAIPAGPTLMTQAQPPSLLDLVARLQATGAASRDAPTNSELLDILSTMFPKSAEDPRLR